MSCVKRSEVCCNEMKKRYGNMLHSHYIAAFESCRGLGPHTLMLLLVYKYSDYHVC